ncbi:MAG: TetR/AcrR family transcriptional regulator [Lentilactobacillus hilgardii]|uniref:TetR/AcrR family transcriptional regulator n=6 Tax=Lentilactobacillus hilgardii TaxID=1588 RepID=UPI0039E7E3EA|nr:TetR/AcrR family transcriptional regulator [Lentilactobacillus hilgardii]
MNKIIKIDQLEENMAEDRRQRKTKTSIQEALIQFLQKKPLNKISVAEIVHEADISRSTFYLHYDDLYDLYDQLNNHFLDGLFESFETYYPTMQTESYFELAQRLINYIDKNKTLFSIFIKENTVSVVNRLSNIFVDKVMQFEKINKDDLQGYYEIVWSVRGMMGIVIEWTQHDMKPDKDDFIEIVRSILDKL